MEKIMDKSKELQSSLILLNDRLHFKGMVDELQPVSIDYIPPLGDNLGYTSLELLLLSLSSCVGSAVLILLRKMKKNLISFEINSRGLRREEHPTGFKNIFLDITLQSDNVTREEFSKVLAMAEEKYCPVWAMIKGNVTLEVNCIIVS